MTHPLKDILQRDQRYPIQAYEFVRDALNYAHEVMGLGTIASPEERTAPAEFEAGVENDVDDVDDNIIDGDVDSDVDDDAVDEDDVQVDAEAGVEHPERHLTGQELCEAGRRLALDQYGMMAKVVLNTWGIQTTSDIGEIVYNMINIDLMRKSPADRREDFNDVYDFQKAFRDDFDFAASMKTRRKSAGL